MLSKLRSLLMLLALVISLLALLTVFRSPVKAAPASVAAPLSACVGYIYRTTCDQCYGSPIGCPVGQQVYRCDIMWWDVYANGRHIGPYSGSYHDVSCTPNNPTTCYNSCG